MYYALDNKSNVYIHIGLFILLGKADAVRGFQLRRARERRKHVGGRIWLDALHKRLARLGHCRPV